MNFYESIKIIRKSGLVLEKMTDEEKREKRRLRRIARRERNFSDKKIHIVHYGVPVDLDVNDLLQGLSRINSINGNLWCFKVLGFTEEYLSEKAPNHRRESDKIIAGIGEDKVREALKKVIDDPESETNKDLIDRLAGWTDAKKEASKIYIRNEADEYAEKMKNEGYEVEVRPAASGMSVTVYFARKSDKPSCYGSGVMDSEIGGYVADMRGYLMDCQAGFKVFSRRGSASPEGVRECAQKLSKKLGALTLKDFKTVDSDYLAPGADWQIVGSGKYGRSAVSYKLRLIRPLDANEFYNHVARKD